MENEFISEMLDEGYWKKEEQSIIIQDFKKYDKITIHHFLEDVGLVARLFWYLKPFKNAQSK